MKPRQKQKASNRIIATSGGRKDLSLTRNSEAYFLALQGCDLTPDTLPYLTDKWCLVALNYLLKGGTVSEEQLAHLDEFAAAGKHVYLDSGCFSLAFEHAKRLGVSAPDVFMTSPTELPFFEEWYAVYTRVVPQIIDRLWGVVELDFGSAAERTATRQRIYDDCGIRPIPVYRFGKDPLSVFTDLVRTHDRICLGGLAKVTPAFRNMAIPILRQMQHDANPDCWVHLLGVSACGAFCASGFSSCDASSYANAARFGLTCGYTPMGFNHSIDWTPKPPRASEIGDGASDFVRYLGMFQHATMNLGRTANMQELANYIL